MNQENASRVALRSISTRPKQQTRRIHERQRLSREACRLKKADRQGDICARHHNAQRMLEELHVVIPYVRHLTFPTRVASHPAGQRAVSCVSSRPRPSYTSISGSSGQLDGPDGSRSLLCGGELDDYRLAYELAKDVLRDTLHELSISARALLRRASLIEDTPFSRRDLRDLTGWSQKRIHQAVHELVDMEYFAAISGANGKAYQYTVISGTGEGPSPVMNLLHPDELAAKLHDSDP